MADSAIYIRRPSNAGLTVAQLLADPTQVANVLFFTYPDNMLEGVDFDSENNIVNQPSPNISGTRFIRKIDNGAKGERFTLYGNFKNQEGFTPSNPNADMKKLYGFKNQLQLDSTNFFYGNVGLYIPNADILTFDPTSTQGMSIDKIHFGFVGKQNQIFDFSVDLSKGGTLTTPP